MFRWMILALALALAGCDTKPQFANTDITGGDFAASFNLKDHTGKARTLADYKGKIVVLFFGYTQCPDVCPTTMATMAQVMSSLGEDANRVQVLFVTVDPQRDTPELLASYVPSFHPDFVGLYGDEQATAAAAQSFRVFYQKQPGKDAASYTVDHTAGTYILDAQGRPRLYVRHGESPDVIAADIRQLLDE